MGTNDYWRKTLNLEEACQDKAFLKKFQSRYAVLRPFFYSLLTLLSKIVFRAKIYGVKNIPQGPPYIIAANHCSAADFPLIAWAMPKEARSNLYSIATSHFYDNPFTRAFILIATPAIRVDTKKGFMEGLRGAARVLALGKSIYINPEGTWSETGKLLPFKPGVGALSFELNVPIVPVYIGGTFEMLPPHSLFIKKFGRITIAFGKPIYPDQYKEMMEKEAAYYIYKRMAEDVRDEVIKLSRSLVTNAVMK